MIALKQIDAGVDLLVNMCLIEQGQSNAWAKENPAAQLQNSGWYISCFWRSSFLIF
jgi:hypothetical protein